MVRKRGPNFDRAAVRRRRPISGELERRGLRGAQVENRMNLLARLNSEWASAVLIVLLAASFHPLSRAWTAARGTALRPVILWGLGAVALAVAAQLCGVVEPLEAGRPWLGRFTYLSTLASLAALLSVLNARTPGAGAWAVLMTMLVVVFLIPWLEEPGRFHQARGLRLLRLDAPWTIFFILVAGTGVTNYLPTRYGPAALALGLGYVLEYLSLTRPDWPAEARAAAWSGFSWSLAAAVWTARRRARRERPVSTAPGDALNQTWLWFRDHWGVVWGLRIAERFNKSAESARWPCRIGWFGTIAGSEGEPASTPVAAVSTFRGLLRRFIKPERLREICD